MNADAGFLYNTATSFDAVILWFGSIVGINFLHSLWFSLFDSYGYCLDLPAWSPCPKAYHIIGTPHYTRKINLFAFSMFFKWFTCKNRTLRMCVYVNLVGFNIFGTNNMCQNHFINKFLSCHTRKTNKI